MGKKNYSQQRKWAILPARIARIDPAQEKKFVEGTYKVRYFWTMSTTKSLKAAEDGLYKEEVKRLLGFIVLQTQLAFFLGSRNKKVILDSYYGEIFLPYNKSVIDQAKRI